MHAGITDGAAQRARAVAAHFVSQSECHIHPHTVSLVTRIQRVITLYPLWGLLRLPARVPEALYPVNLGKAPHPLPEGEGKEGVLRTAIHPAKLAGYLAVRST